MFTYLTLCVDGKTFKFIESGWNYAIKNQKLAEHLRSRNEKGIVTSGAVDKPTFILGGVRYSHLDKLYKLSETV